MKKIYSQDIDFHSLSFLDRNGRLFKFKGDLYRAIGTEKSILYRQFFEQGVINTLIDKKLLVDTQITDYSLEGYDLVLYHQSIPFVAYPHEWSDTMFRDAALLHLDLVIELEKHNLATDDGVAINILFDGCSPIFIDFCSIELATTRPLWPGKASDQFQCMFMRPLHIMAQGHARIARAVVRDSYYMSATRLERDYTAFSFEQSSAGKVYGFRKSFFQALRNRTPKSIRPYFKSGYHLFRKGESAIQVNKRSDFLQQLKEEVLSLEFPSFNLKEQNYFKSTFPVLESSDNWTEQQKYVHRAITACKPNSFLDADSDLGWYAHLAALEGCQVVALDDNEACVRKIYADSQEKSLSILPLLIDFLSPKYDLGNDFFAPEHERLACEMVMCLTLLQHLLLKRSLNLEKALSRLSKLSRRWVLIEFMPPEKLLGIIPPHNQLALEMWKEGNYYSLNAFLDELKGAFQDVDILATYDQEHRLILCRK